MNDLSDEAFELWARELLEFRAHKGTWQECRRRAEEREREAHRFGFTRGQLIPKDSVYDGESAEPQCWNAYKWLHQR